MLLPIEYVSSFIMLLAAAILYFKVAACFNIVDIPNQRSSHQVATIRGGGVIFLVAVMLFFFWSNFSYPYLFTAVMMAGCTSFLDDLVSLNNRLKFSVHAAAVVLVFMQCGLLTLLPPVYLVITGIVVIGAINAYNFMDGINGITGLYSLALIVPLLLTETNGQLRSLEVFLVMGLLVFNFFNARKNARCFAGDVGSISLAIVIAFLLIARIQQTGSFTYAGLLLLYGIDAVYTIAQRLYQKENIFKPHRKHLYQYYSNEKKLPHIVVSAWYAMVQLVISLAIVYGHVTYTGLFILFILLSIAYWLLKAPFLKVAFS